MEEEVQLPMPSLQKNSSSSSKIRFLGLLKQPDSVSNPFELDESDVIWSADLSDSSPSLDASGDPNSPAFSTVSSSSNSPTSSRQSFCPDKLGLSAALSEDNRPLLQRKPSLNPSLSATSAARTITPVPPLPASRSASSSEDLPGSSYSGKLLQSAPVNVPVWPRANGTRGKMGFFHQVEDEGAEDEMLPPHEIVARSQSHTTTFSVFEGVGRTLKGRDLRRVRNAVWQKTGNDILMLGDLGWDRLT